MWHTVCRLLSDPHDAEDCYQETFLKAKEYASRHEVANWAGLLTRIASARAMDRLRLRYRSPTKALVDVPESASKELSPPERAEVMEQVEILRDLLAELPPKQAEVFLLSEIELMGHSR